eukprot:TRINITY_DN10554_c0_g1_i3.p1 TRINITY_DN10554_c0_g1~~TRINITY_DN10554_c0_g1_i3.p1  ORF type:complete len:115 (-),score=23.70 TRINITY_DN10554_c0_g1_i3:193-537(-)
MFAVPDFRGRVAVGAGKGPGLSDYFIGQTGGTESVTLTVSQLPSHNHQLAINSNAAMDSLAGNYLANPPISIGHPAKSTDPDDILAANSISMTGQNAPVDIRPAYTSVRYIIKF